MASNNLFLEFICFDHEQPWPSGNALDSDQHGPGLEAQMQAIGDVRKGIRS